MKPFKFMARLLGCRAKPDPYAPSVVAAFFDVPLHPEAERIAASIRDYPQDWAWAMKGYKMIHTPSGFVLWVANQDYGLAEVYSNGGKGDFSKPEQEIIWPAVEEWLARHKIGFAGRLPKATIYGRSGTFWCYAKEHPWAGAGCSPAEAYQVWSYAVSAQARNGMSQQEYLEVRSVSL